MKLLNKSLVWLSLALLLITGACTFIFYLNVIDEIRDSVDDGLDNYKRQIVRMAEKDSTILKKNNFENGFFSIQELSKAESISEKNQYINTMMDMQDENDQSPELEPVRMLTGDFELNGHYYKIQIINPMAEEEDLIENLIYDAIWLYLLLMASIIVINNFIFRKLWKPFYSFLEQLKNYRLGSSKNFPEIATTIKEFNDLQHAATILLRHTVEAYEQQKQFIGNASHELQTPLAIIINKLELLIEKGNLQNEQAETISNIMNIIDRLVRLNKSLLLLTKIENKQFFNNKLVSFNDIVRQTVNDFSEIAAHKKIKISVVENAELKIEADSSLATTIVSNLLRNAIFHNISGGLVTIDIAKNSIQIRNTGTKEPLNQEKIFSRFYKSNTEQKGAGPGLGLAIVKAICNLYGFLISYRFENDLHCFEVRLR